MKCIGLSDQIFLINFIKSAGPPSRGSQHRISELCPPECSAAETELQAGAAGGKPQLNAGPQLSGCDAETLWN